MKEPVAKSRLVLLSVLLLITSFGVRAQDGQTSPSPGSRNYLKMTEAEQRAFIAQKAEDLSYTLRNRAGMSVQDKITPEAVAAIKPFVDAYAQRQDAARQGSGCDYGREHLSAVLGRWCRHQAAITRAWDAERDLEKPVPDSHWEWLVPRIGPHLAMVESEFCLCQPGENGKLGVFQLTREVAAKYGLQVRTNNTSSGADERCDVTKAATAAARYLKTLVGDKNNPLRTLIALARYHRGADVSLPAGDSFWAFVACKEYSVTNSVRPNATERPWVETQAFTFIQQLFAAGILIEHPEYFDTSLPPEAAGEARMGKMRRKVDAEFLKGMSSAVLLKFVLQPQTEFDEWLKTESANMDLLAGILELSPVPASRAAAAFPALRNAPPWLHNLVSNLARVRRLSARITSHQYHDQTVYYLKSNIISILYDKAGEVMCARDFMEEKGNASEKCPDFNPQQRDGKLLWESVKRK